MPDVVFVLPHWLYWLGLAVFPLVAMVLARHYRPRAERGYSLVTSYFIWIVSGFLGLHRLYLRNLWGLLFWPLFGVILYASAMEGNVRIKVSDARAGIEFADKSSLRSQRRLERSTAIIVETRAQLAEAESDSSADSASRIELLQRRIDREQERVDEAQARVSAIESEREALEAELVEAETSQEFWANFARTMFYGVLAFLALDGLALPWLKRRAEARRSARVQQAPQQACQRTLPAHTPSPSLRMIVRRTTAQKTTTKSLAARGRCAFLIEFRFSPASMSRFGRCWRCLSIITKWSCAMFSIRRRIGRTRACS